MLKMANLPFPAKSPQKIHFWTIFIIYPSILKSVRARTQFDLGAHSPPFSPEIFHKRLAAREINAFVIVMWQ